MALLEIKNLTVRFDTSNGAFTAVDGVDVSVDVYVLHRESPAHEWRVANNRPHPNWRRMSVNEYIKHGRSEMLQIASPCEILKVSRAVFANGHS